MGIYAYKTTPKATRTVCVLTTDGMVQNVLVQVYSFAYKLWSDDELNAKLEARYIAPARRAFGKAGRGPVGLAIHSEAGVGDTVYVNNAEVSPLEFGDGLKVYGKIIKTSRMARVPSAGLKVKTDPDQISLHYHGKPMSFFLNSHPSYRPSVYCNGDNHNYGPYEIAEKTIFADAYDAAMIAKGDSRRAYRC
jgi:hypothetical protein